MVDQLETQLSDGACWAVDRNEVDVTSNVQVGRLTKEAYDFDLVPSYETEQGYVVSWSAIDLSTSLYRSWADVGPGVVAFQDDRE